MLDGVDGGDAQRVADGRVGGAAAALAEDAVPTAEVDDLVDDEEVAGEAELLDDGELVGDHRVGAGLPLGLARAVAIAGALVGEVSQPGGLGMPRRHRVRWQVRRDELEIERALLRDVEARGERVGVMPVHVSHLLRRADVRGRRREPAVEIVEAGACPDGGQGVGELLVAGGGAVDVAGGDDREPSGVRQIDQQLAAGGVQRCATVGDLDGDVASPESLHQSVELCPRRLRRPIGQGWARALGGRRPGDSR